MRNFSIIIAMGKGSPYVERCVAECLKLPQAKEVIVVPDEKIILKPKDKRLRIIPSGKVGPGHQYIE